MNEQESKRLDTSLALYKQQMEHYHKTQAFEWKGTLGAWALVVSAVALTFQDGANLLPGPWVYLALMIPIFHSVWLLRIHESEEYDKDLWVKYRNAACEMVNLDKGAHVSRGGSTEAFWITTEAGPTFVFAIIFVWRVLAGPAN